MREIFVKRKYGLFLYFLGIEITYSVKRRKVLSF